MTKISIIWQQSSSLLEPTWRANAVYNRSVIGNSEILDFRNYIFFFIFLWHFGGNRIHPIYGFYTSFVFLRFLFDDFVSISKIELFFEWFWLVGIAPSCVDSRSISCNKRAAFFRLYIFLINCRNIVKTKMEE